MVSLSNTPLQPLTDRSTTNSIPPLVQEIKAKRLGYLSNTTSSSTVYISQLEDYLSFIIDSLYSLENSVAVDRCLEYASTLVFSEGSYIPWKLPTKAKRTGTSSWTLKDEIILVCCNVSLGYSKRCYELTLQVSGDPISDAKIWLNCFKLGKRGLGYTQFIKQLILQSTTNGGDTDDYVWESSLDFVNFVDSSLDISIQYTFLSKCLWKLQSLEYDITMDQEINYSTLSRVAIHIKSKLSQLIKEVQYRQLQEYWLESLEVTMKLINGIIGAFVSIENYKQDKIGVAIGFINWSLDNVVSKKNGDDSDEDEDDNESENKLKKKFSMFKKKVNDKSNKLKVDLQKKDTSKKKKLKINKSLYNKLSTPLQRDYMNLFQLIELLNMKYHLENNNLKFDKIISQQDLINHTPLGRAVPMDIKPWRPVHTNSGMGGSQNHNPSSGYY